MGRRKAKVDAILPRLPHADSIGLHALRRDFRRPELAPMIEYGPEQDGPQCDRDLRGERLDLAQSEISEGRNQVEIPDPVHVTSNGNTAALRPADKLLEELRFFNAASR